MSPALNCSRVAAVPDSNRKAASVRISPIQNNDYFAYSLDIIEIRAYGYFVAVAGWLSFTRAPDAHIAQPAASITDQP